MAEHTPTPWRVSRTGRIQGPQRQLDRGLQDIAGMITTNNDVPNTIANAAFIVKAVNSHDANEAKIKALVKALRACRDELVLVQNGSTGGIPNAIMALIPERIAEADAALALCEQNSGGGGHE